MPSLRLCGQSWHLASDALALAGAALLLVNACWLAVYLGVLLALGRPQKCSTQVGSSVLEHREHQAVVWGLLALFSINICTSEAMVLVGSLGAAYGGAVVCSADCLNDKRQEAERT